MVQERCDEESFSPEGFRLEFWKASNSNRHLGLSVILARLMLS